MSNKIPLTQRYKPCKSPCACGDSPGDLTSGSGSSSGARKSKGTLVTSQWGYGALAGTSCGCLSLDGHTLKPTLSVSIVA